MGPGTVSCPSLALRSQQDQTARFCPGSGFKSWPRDPWPFSTLGLTNCSASFATRRKLQPLPCGASVALSFPLEGKLLHGWRLRPSGIFSA